MLLSSPGYWKRGVRGNAPNGPRSGGWRREVSICSAATPETAASSTASETSAEIDLHAVSERDDGTDLVVEVKDWERPLTRDAAASFVATREKLRPLLPRRTAFLLYSEGGVSRKRPRCWPRPASWSSTWTGSPVTRCRRSGSDLHDRHANGMAPP